MNKLDFHSPSLVHPSEARLEFPAKLDREHHLIVLASPDFDFGLATQRIWQLANSTGMSVLLLSLCKDPTQEPSLRRGLAAIVALIQQGRISAETKIEIGTSWVDVVRRIYHRGDMIVCFAEQHAGILKRPLSQILQYNLNATVYVLSGLYPQLRPRLNWLSQTLAWVGSLGIIVAAFLLQIRITSLPPDWAQTSLLIFSVIGEIWLISYWNHLFG